MIRNRLRAELADQCIVTVDHFLSAPVCRRMLRETATGDWVPSGVATPAGRAQAYANGRSSTTLMGQRYSPWMALQLRNIEDRLRTTFGIMPSRLEPWQVTRYRRGERFDYHLDCGCWQHHPSGERKRTILFYIQQPQQGGVTHFRALHEKITPVVGRLVVWNNLLASGNCNHAMIHSGRPVWRGHKIVLTTWEREYRYVR